jgi:hypothetical protein
MRAAHLERTTKCQRATTTATSQRHRAITGPRPAYRRGPARASSRSGEGRAGVPAGQAGRGAGPASNSGWLGRRSLAGAAGTSPAAGAITERPGPARGNLPMQTKSLCAQCRGPAWPATPCRRGGNTPCNVRNTAPCRDLVPSGASPGQNRGHARKQEIFNRGCTQMHADRPDSGMCVHSKSRPTGHDEPRRCGGPCPIRVHLRASAVENLLLASPRAAPARRSVRSLRKRAPHAPARTAPIASIRARRQDPMHLEPGRSMTGPPNPAALTTATGHTRPGGGHALHAR